MSNQGKKAAAAARATQARTTPDAFGFKAIALPALAAATRRKPQGRTERRAGIVLDPGRCTD